MCPQRPEESVGSLGNGVAESSLQPGFFKNEKKYGCRVGGSLLSGYRGAGVDICDGSQALTLPPWLS